MFTVPLVLTIQIQACTPAPNILRWYLLFPWYWPFKFKHDYTHQKIYVNVFCSLGTDDLWYHTEHSSMHLSWCTTMLWQPKSHRINVTIKINCISATTLNTDMLSKRHTKSRPIKKVGFFCYRCGHDDFGLNQKSLSAHFCHCSFDPYSMSLTKRESDHLPKFSPLFW